MAESSEISADGDPVGLARLPHRLHRRTTRHVEIPDIIALHKAVGVVDIAELLHPVAVDRMAVAAAEPTAVVADPTTAATADSQPINDLPSAR